MLERKIVDFVQIFDLIFPQIKTGFDKSINSVLMSLKSSHDCDPITFLAMGKLRTVTTKT